MACAGCRLGGRYVPASNREDRGAIGAGQRLDRVSENAAVAHRLGSSGYLACPVEAQTGDITVLPYCNGQFDAVWCSNVTQYLTGEQMMTAMEEFMRVTKSGGLVAIKEVDISVWQFHPQSPLMMWRLLQALQANVQVAGAMRSTRLPKWFRSVGLIDIRSKTVLAERRHPMDRVERDYIRGLLNFCRGRPLIGICRKPTKKNGV